MSLPRRTRGLIEVWISSVYATSNMDEMNSGETSQNSSCSASTKSAPERCLICEQANASFPEVSPWDDSATPPSICIACVERSLSIADKDKKGAYCSPTSSLQASPPENASKTTFCLECYRRLLTSDFPERYIVESCQHEPNVCLDCIEGSIIRCLDADLPQIISCPQCGDMMSAVDVWRLSGVQTFER